MNRAERRREERLKRKRSSNKQSLSLEPTEFGFTGRFHSMASPCELIVDTENQKTARSMLRMASDEATRIEKKFSRYNSEGAVYQIHQSLGQEIRVDEETAHLLNFADQCYEISDGLFDITSGVLRKVWTFDGSDKVPSQEEISKTLKFVGWNKIHWDGKTLIVPRGMQIDFGGIGKEYAVDRICNLLSNQFSEPFLLNMGGDLRAPRERINGQQWMVGIESPNQFGNAVTQLELKVGALATSGDSRRFLLKDGKRYSHILNPKTGWPIENAPRSVTVAADTCTEAGMFSTIASMCGSQAKQFLDDEGVHSWVFQ